MMQQSYGKVHQLYRGLKQYSQLHQCTRKSNMLRDSVIGGADRRSASYYHSRGGSRRGTVTQNMDNRRNGSFTQAATRADQCTFSQDWQKPDGSKKSTADMSVISELCDIYCLLNFGAMDEMGDRIIELENSINDLIAEIRVDCSPYPLTPLKQRSGSAKQEDGSA
ncbi:hypothetical protein V6N11_083609 [Hibiscus sabdariffa]|uniref:Uncharacterized protein n=1 Tax=Hibiscus sabdariffa TaxID=183260 RepID=A0ABR2QC24_9ROSI